MEPIRVRPAGSGFAVEGPGFYLWDEDRAAVLQAAHALLCGGQPRALPRRLLVIESPPVHAGDPEALDA